jgi:hypothetical protein
MDRSGLVRSIRIARAASRTDLAMSKHSDAALARNSCNDTYAQAEKFALDGLVGWERQTRAALEHAQLLERLALDGNDSHASSALDVLSRLQR